MPGLSTPVPLSRPSFLQSTRVEDLADLAADIAVIGLPYNEPYNLIESRSNASDAPDAIREQSSRLYPNYLTHFDADFDGELLAGRSVGIADCGDVALRPGAFAANRQTATDAVKAILARGAVPFVLGGDHATTIPIVRAYEGRGPIAIVQIDAHIDWRDEVNGVREGLSSPMRRSAELPWVTGLLQVGIRGMGSARRQEFADARAWGSRIVTAQAVHSHGVDHALAQLPDAAGYYLTFDMDGLDPSIAPGVKSRAFGGLTYYQALNLIKGVAQRGPIVGLDLVEIAPANDISHLTTQLAARLLLATIGALAHAGRVGR